ncbi:MAG: ATP-binding protein [Myxococcales bacterium]
MVEEELREPRRLADFLRERRAGILGRWKQEVARLRPAGSLSEPILLDHVPEFLDGLEQYVGDVRAGLSVLPDPAIPRIHAVERLGLGFELGDVVEEYTILRACITELLADEQAPAARSVELPRLHQAIDRAIAASVQRYEQEAAALRGELGAEAAHQRSLALERLRQVERHAAELEAVIESLPDAVYIGDAKGIKRSNAAALAQLGLEKPRDLDGNIADLSERIQVRDPRTKEPVPITEQVFARALRGERAVSEVLIRHAKSGADRILRSAAAPIMQGGRAIGAVAINTDITERKRIEEELRAAVEFGERIRGVLGHDLRNPLGVITASASLLQATSLDAQQQRVAARIQSAAQRIARMTHDLLDYTRARVGGGIPVTRRPADAGEIARQVVDEAQVLGAGGAIEFSAEGDLGGEWDADRLNQALWNLLDNALRYGAPGDPVSVGARADEARVRLSVHNRGPPIAEESLPFLFEPFRRGSHAPAGRGAGLGLGLYIVGEIARAHGGELRARSTATEGTTFELVLPRTAS